MSLTTSDQEQLCIAYFLIVGTSAVFDTRPFSRLLQWIIVIGVGQEQIRKAPEMAAGTEVIRQYDRGSKAEKDVEYGSGRSAR